MDLKFTEMSVDTSLAQEYLKKNKSLSELYKDYDEIVSKFKPYVYDGKVFIKNSPAHVTRQKHYRNILLNMASSLKRNATLIAQLEYYIRNIPIEVTNAQLNLIIQDMKCLSEKKTFYYPINMFSYPKGSLLNSGRQLVQLCNTGPIICYYKETAAICHLLVTLVYEAGAYDCYLQFSPTPTRIQTHIKYWPVKDLDSGAVAVVSDDADVDSAVDKFITVSKQAPWRLRRILVQESVYQQFKDALKWKCKLKKSGSKTLTSDVLCSDTLTYNDRTFLIDPVELTEENPSVVTVEAYRTTKEMISLVQQDETRYLSLWTNGIAEINEVTHNVKSPVVWVNNIADFRGPAQVSEAVFSYTHTNVPNYLAKKCDRSAKLYEVSQSWMKLDVESRREVLCSVLDKCTLLNPENLKYAEIRDSLLVCTLSSFEGAGKDYVCRGISKPVGFVHYDGSFSLETFKSILLGNAILLFSTDHESSVYELLKQEGVPVGECEYAHTQEPNKYFVWPLSFDTLTQVVWTNSGTIFAN